MMRGRFAPPLAIERARHLPSHLISFLPPPSNPEAPKVRLTVTCTHDRNSQHEPNSSKQPEYKQSAIPRSHLRTHGIMGSL